MIKAQYKLIKIRKYLIIIRNAMIQKLYQHAKIFSPFHLHLIKLQVFLSEIN